MPIFFAGKHIGQLGAVADQITELADFRRRDKAGFDHIAHKKVTDPSGILAVSLVTSLRLCVFKMSKSDETSFFKDVENGDPVLAG